MNSLEAISLATQLNEQLKDSLGDKAPTIKVTHGGGTRKTNYSVKVQKMVTRTNMMSGKEYQEDEDTPIHMSPASETYWSM